LVHLSATSSHDAGRGHGAAHAGEIRALATLRTELTRTVGGFASSDEVLRAAAEHVDVLESFDADLHQELIGIAEGAGVTPADIVVLNHYTDLRDLKRSGWGVDADGGCSLIYGREAKVLAQTWDMHASAMPFVTMLHVPEGNAPEAWLLSLTGCLGMAGMNRHGVAIGINNLHSKDAQVGVVWSALVRRALREKTAEAALEVLENSPVGSGHNYFVADRQRGFALETSGVLRKLIYKDDDGPSFVHTNHCLDDDVAACSRVPPGSSTYDRLEWLSKSVGERPIEGIEDAWTRLGSVEGYPRSVCTNMSTFDKPHASATCAGIAMDMQSSRVWACAGQTHRAPPNIFVIPGPTK
jgi:isopenicillin-N N-acyltransferase-like protein